MKQNKGKKFLRNRNLYIIKLTVELMKCPSLYTGKGRKNETEIIFVVFLQINKDIPNLVSNTQAVYNYEHPCEH